MSYPATIDTFTIVVPDGLGVWPSRADAPTETDLVNGHSVSITAIETELGAHPSGSEATVAARFATVEGVVAGHIGGGDPHGDRAYAASLVAPGVDLRPATLTAPSNVGPIITLGTTSALIQNRDNPANTPLALRAMTGQVAPLLQGLNASGAATSALYADGTFVANGGVMAPFLFPPSNTGAYMIPNGAWLHMIGRDNPAWPVVVIRPMATANGHALLLEDAAANPMSGFTANGRLSYWGHLTSLSVGGAGSAAALPATPAGYALFDVAGVQYKIPFYPN